MVSTKKLAFIHDLPVGGAKRTFASIIPLLARQFDVTVFEFDRADRKILDIAAFSGVSHRVFKAPRLPPQELSRIPVIGQILQWRQLENEYRKIAVEVNGGMYDAVLVGQCRVVNSPPVLRMLRKPTVYYCHEPSRAVHELSIARTGRQTTPQWRRFSAATTRWFSRRRELNVVASADALIANSYYSAEALYRVFGVKAHVAYPGVDGEVFCQQEVPLRNMVLSIGALQRLKGHDFAIACVSAMPATTRPQLVIAGPAGTQSNAERQYLELIASQAHVDLHIETGISDRDLARLYSSAIATICSPHLEPFGLVSIESMACATPVLGVREGGLRETIVDGETGFLLPWRVEAFAERLSFLQANTDERIRIGRRGRNHVLSSFTWQRCADATASVIMNAISAKSDR